MTAPLFISLLVVAVLLVYLVIAVRTWARVRGARLVVCPETKVPVVVNVDVGHAVASALWERPEVRLESCDRWSERGECAQPCVPQIETAPDATNPRAIAAYFFGKEHCVICSHPIEAPSRMTLQPGFMNPETREVDTWDGLPLQDLPRAMATWRPLCANCTIAEMSRQQFPDRVTDRLPH